MNAWEGLYDQSEITQVRFIGFHTESARYDFAIVYTNQFFGKPLIIDIQTNRSILLSPYEVNDIQLIQKAFHIELIEEAEDLSYFLRYYVPGLPLVNQY